MNAPRKAANHSKALGITSNRMPQHAAPDHNENDGLAVAAACVELTAGLVQALERTGACAPGVYESLRGIQLMLDRQVHSLAKSGALSAEAMSFRNAFQTATENTIPAVRKTPSKARAKMALTSITRKV